MKELRINDTQTIKIRANLAARLFYKQKFDTELDKDLQTLSMLQIGQKMQRFDHVEDAALRDDLEALAAMVPEADPILGAQIVWAMAKAQANAEGALADFTDDFTEWVLRHADLDINDHMDAFTEEVKAGFFRRSKSSA